MYKDVEIDDKYRLIGNSNGTTTVYKGHQAVKTVAGKVDRFKEMYESLNEQSN